MKKAAIYNPYWDTLGGGERYALSFARVLADNGFSVDIQWKESEILNLLNERFNIATDGLNVVADIKRGDGYEVCFWVSDGSIPLLRSRKNIIHFQFPFRNTNGSSIYNRAKMFRIKHIVVNSEFTKSFIDEEYSVKSTVLYPPVDTQSFKKGRKEKIILYVGRFSQLTQKKNHHLLIKAFKKLIRSGVKDWRLVLAGGVDVGVEKSYFTKIKDLSKDLNVEIIKNPKFSDLVKLYKSASVFWTASGIGVNEQKHPKKVEHFGITLVEAMSAGCVVFASDAGGHREIVKHEKNGYLWSTTSQLAHQTKNVLANKTLVKEISSKASLDSQKYSYENFAHKLMELI